MGIKLNLGSGDVELEGYVNIDIKKGQLAYPLPQYKEDSVDEIRVSHLLEHYSHREVEQVIKEWRRVLKVNGILKIAVPNLDYIVEKLKQKSNEPLQSYMMGGQTDDNDYHKSTYNYDSLSLILQQAHFDDIRPWVSDAPDCSSLPVSLNLQGRKQRRCAAIWSMPRLGYTTNWKCAADIFPKLKIDIHMGTGAYWSQVLTRIMQQVIEKEYEMFFTLDYDTVFTPLHIKYMLSLMENFPEIDCLCPIQVKREASHPMFALQDKDGNPISSVAVQEFYDAPLMKASSGHFGLTLFRTRAFKDLKKPWFLGVPDSKGEWGDMNEETGEKGRLDDDIYFWRNFNSEGRQMYLANHVMIGHYQQVISWPGTFENNFEPIHQYQNDFDNQGVPSHVQQLMLKDLK